MPALRPYADPHATGVCLGLVLLACFALTGQGLGASGAFASVASGVVVAVSPETAVHSAYFHSYLQHGSPWTAWLVVEILGVMVGAAVSAALAGRIRLTFVRAVRPSGALLSAGIGGGMLMGVGAALARGCTSGLALSGGTMLSVGAWIFMVALFLAGFLVAPMFRRLWS
ncbi:YeeE/YedE thiosulfate transporter family protein [Rhodanobacter sp. AS-Z3]|uniref:YeeE/YedE thiosulfate transporter family protein n=1 Tax=Rhodanobacter sp. AS-Z3 TaxID=3031330 RepID=UPI00247A40BC|nr:YeeE/YedE thiosulfate transporter family protein [Rhodanobacter sp. AS-Z3]WEN13953.1 YeeE/YedE thiosulfate transporter family protein [Rhodanobacter sp. AS-Z3]